MQVTWHPAGGFWCPLPVPRIAHRSERGFLNATRIMAEAYECHPERESLNWTSAPLGLCNAFPQINLILFGFELKKKSQNRSAKDLRLKLNEVAKSCSGHIWAVVMEPRIKCNDKCWNCGGRERKTLMLGQNILQSWNGILKIRGGKLIRNPDLQNVL